jgi:integrase
LRRLLAEADVQTRAAILLGINCGFGNSDVASLPLSAVDLERGWIDFPRPKTGVHRRCPLWGETADALRAALEQRPKPKHETDAGLFFLARTGKPLMQRARSDDPRKFDQRVDLVGAAFLRLHKKLGLPRRGFYPLRHTFRTKADRARDPQAIGVVMGHSDSSMAANYTHGIDDDRLHAVIEVVHLWLYGPDGETTGDAKPKVGRKAKSQLRVVG